MLSIIITTYNRSDILGNAVDSLVKQSLPKSNYEVIVVDNNSTDDTGKIISNFIKNHPDINLHYVLEKNQGLSFARNRGINKAVGDIIAFMDDDATAHEDYCLNLYNYSRLYEDYDAFGGKVIPFYQSGKEPEWLSKHVWGMIARVDLGDKIKPFDRKYPVGCNMAFRRKVFEEVGMFNTNLYRCDDKDIFYRLKRKKFKILYLPDVAVNHFIPESRISRTGIRKLATVSGTEERIMLSRKPVRVIFKIIDYSIKIIAAIILGAMYSIRGHPEKALIINIMYWSLKGFIKPLRISL